MFGKSKTNKHLLKESDQLKILTIKVIEEHEPALFNEFTLAKANIAALSSQDDPTFIAKRASYLYDLLPASFKTITRISSLPFNRLHFVLLVSFLIGLSSNYLGANQNIHIFYNPFTILLAWNLLAYIMMVVKGIISFQLPDVPLNRRHKEKNPTEGKKHDVKPKERQLPFFLRWLSKLFFKKMMLAKANMEESKEAMLVLKSLINPFWKEYLKMAGQSMLYKFKSLTNLSAAGILLGALAGIYLRGLFFKYNVFWQSTFISDLETIRLFLNVLFGPAHLILYGRLLSTNDLTSLLQPNGVSAAPWIHLMAVTAVLYVLIPRTLLAVHYAHKAKKAFKPLDFSEDYYQNQVLKYKASIIKTVKNGIDDIINKKTEVLSNRIADFVVKDFYDDQIVPVLLNFRKNGGKISDLEKELAQVQKQFEPILMEYLEKVEEEFKESIVNEISLFLGQQFDIHFNLSYPETMKGSGLDKKLPGKLATEVGDTLGGTFVTTLALTTGSLTGGIGKSLGTAILVSLLGVSGPVGMLIGALATAATLGGVYHYKRKEITNFIKEVPLPSVIVSLTLNDKKIKKTREETMEFTRKEIKRLLQPKKEEITDKVLRSLAL